MKATSSSGKKRTFRLKTLLVIVAALGLACGLLRNSINRNIYRNSIVADVEALGGHVAFDAASWQKRVPDWGIALYRGNPAIFPVAVESPFGVFSEDDQTLEDARSLFSRVSDEDLVIIAKLKTLRRVDLTGTQVTEEGRDWLSRTLPNCEITMP